MNARTAQWLAAGLGFVLIVLVGAVIFILLSRPAQGPRVSPTPSLVAVVSPSASASPIVTPSLFPTFSLPPTASLPPTPTAVITPLITPLVTPPITPPATPTLPPPPTAPPTPSPSPTPPPTPTAPPVATSAARQLRVMGLGLDARNVIGGVERFLVFTTDGPSIVRATISNSTDRSRVCLWQGTDIANRQCDTMRNGELLWPVFEPGSLSWTLSLIGANETTAPTVDVTLDFNAAAPSVEFRNLRYQGTPVPNYNGVTAGLDVLGPGTLQIDGAFDPGQEHQYHVVIVEADDGTPVRDETGGPANTFTVTHVVAPTFPPPQPSYVVSVTNPNPVEEPLAVFLHARVSWP